MAAVLNSDRFKRIKKLKTFMFFVYEGEAFENLMCQKLTRGNFVFEYSYLR